jgi:ubiquinone/menaquinone biosynthesis C-methylase UbiE
MNEAKHLQLNEVKWDKWADTLDGKSWRNNYLRNAQSSVISRLGAKQDIHFLDVGCGTGWAVGQVAKLVDGRGQFYGVDLSTKMVERAQENFNGLDNFHFLQANAESIPLDANSFDSIICTNSFHHYLHPDLALREMYRLLKVGGKLFILDPTADTWVIKLADKIIKLFEPEHVKLYSTLEFQQMFQAAGLKYVASDMIQGQEKVHIGQK